MIKFKCKVLTLIVVTLLLQSCLTTKLVYHNLRSPEEGFMDLSPHELKISYSITSNNYNPIEKALLDCLNSAGISDVIASDRLEQDRINIYMFERDKMPGQYDRYFRFLNGCISFCSLYMIPYYITEVYPIELHIVTPYLPKEEQVKIIKTEYLEKIIIWTPLWLNTANIKHDQEDSTYNAMQLIFDDLMPELFKN